VTDQPPSDPEQQRRALHPHTHHLRVERTARYYTLGASGGAPKSIWFMLHGYGQLAGDFIRYFGDLANDDTLLVAPEAMNRFYLVSPDKAPARDRPVGATWMTREDRDSEIADYVEYLDALHAELAVTPASFGAKVNVVGFSQGAATATRWITHGKAQIDRLILWGGLLPPETDLTRGHAALRYVALTLVLGESDQYVNEQMLAAETVRLEQASVPFDVVRYEGGHSIKRVVFPRLVGSVGQPRSG
jgi:predicted esterase